MYKNIKVKYFPHLLAQMRNIILMSQNKLTKKAFIQQKESIF